MRPAPEPFMHPAGAARGGTFLAPGARAEQESSWPGDVRSAPVPQDISQ